MSYGALGADLLEGPMTWTPPAPMDYLAAGPGLEFLSQVASATMDILLSGSPDSIRYGGALNLYVDSYPEIQSLYGGHESSARLIAETVLRTLIEQERQKPAAGRLDVYALATVLVSSIIHTLQNGGDPSACITAFDDTFGDWKSVSVLTAPKSTSKTGYCKKSVVFPWDGKGNISPGCRVEAICRAGTDAAGRNFVYESGPPAAGDLRVTAPGGEAPVPTPTHADIRKSVEQKMVASGETLESIEWKDEFAELVQYLEALTTVRRWLSYSLGLSAAATESDVAKALHALGIAPGEAADWFRGCNFDESCFRLTMNRAIGAAKQDRRDTRAKIVVAVGAVAAVGAFLFFRR